MTYTIPQFASENQVDWEQAETASLESYAWGCGYRPRTTAKLVYVQNRGFIVRMRCEESDPLALYTQDNDPVYTDSCMEFFACYQPENPDAGYINFEMNARGAVLSAYGRGRGERTPLLQMGLQPEKPQIEMGDGWWQTTLLIPLSLLEQVYGALSFEKGDSIRGNFYKCGDETASPHYGSFFPIDLPHPDFHCPKFFGEMVIA